MDPAARGPRWALAALAWVVGRCVFRVQGTRTVRLLWRAGGRPVGSLCPLRRVTGRPCPGCGMTRAVGLLVHGHPRAATRMNPLVWGITVMLLASPTAVAREVG